MITRTPRRVFASVFVEISPRMPGIFEVQPEWHLYSARAEKYKASKAHMTKVLRYVTEQRIEW